ncbi:integrin alpha-6-like [Lampetra fluviatilis]
MGAKRTLVFLALLGPVGAFNLDPAGALLKTQPGKGLFGFSLAFHTPRTGAPPELLVGAPTSFSANPRFSSVQTGALFRCSVTAGGCRRVDIDVDYDPSKESKQDQWLGSVVRSSGVGGKVVVCAHRYEVRSNVGQVSESRSLIGRCYLLDQDLRDKTRDPIHGGQYHFCDGRAATHEWFGVCQQGLDAGFTHDTHYLYSGAVGSYYWRGVVHVDAINLTLVERGEVLNDGPYETGDERIKNGNDVPVEQNSYLGFSMESGIGVTDKDRETFVAGAPRANHTGAVLFLKISPPSSMEREQVLYGEQLASSFGYDVALVDINNDGWKDLVVGAPQFFDIKEHIGGAAYIYLNKNGHFDAQYHLRLNGTTASMFGLCVAAVGDLNQDGFPDVAVGAPYDGLGKVFIYHGGSQGLNPKATQVIEGEAFSSPIRFFGYSLVGGIDVDGNSYPDIAVGSLSEQVAIIRSRPVVSIETVINKPMDININEKNCGPHTCANIDACFTYQGNNPTSSPGTRLIFTASVDMDRVKASLSPRAVFLDDAGVPQQAESSGFVDLGGQNSKKCIRRTLQIKDDIKDKLRPLKVSFDYKLQGSRRRRQASGGQERPVLDLLKPSSSATNINFAKDGCGSDNICQSNLQLAHLFCRFGGNNSYEPLPTEGHEQVLLLSGQEELALQLTITNPGDDAYESRLSIRLPPSLGYMDARPKEFPPGQPPVCNANANGTLTECELGNPLKRGESVVFYLLLSTNALNADQESVNVELQLATTSEQSDLVPQTARLQVRTELLLTTSGVAKPSQVYFGDSMEVASTLKKEDTGNIVEYELTVHNLGKSLGSLASAYLNMSMPAFTPSGKQLLYVTSTSVVAGAVERSCMALGSDGQFLRKRRDETKEGNKEAFISKLKKKYFKLQCGSGDVLCQLYHCPLQGMDTTAVVKIRAKLWNSTFTEEYDDANYLDLISSVTTGLFSQSKNIILKGSGLQTFPVRLTVFPEKSTVITSGFPWWIILVAILVGILLLALLLFLLWKCGCLNFNRKADLYEAKYYHDEVEVQPSETAKLTSDC